MLASWLEALLTSVLEGALAFAASVVRALFGLPESIVRHATEPVALRPARAEEVIDVRLAVLRPGRPRDTAVFDGDHDADTRHWVAERSGMVIGVVSVMRTSCPDSAVTASWQLRGMAVLPEYRGTGLGASLLQRVHLDVDDDLWCNAREHVEPFYARYGWQPVGEVFDIPVVGPHRRMWRRADG